MSVVALLENIRAANNGASASCAQTVYDIFQPILYHLSELLDLFHNYNYVVVEIFQVLCSVVQNLMFLQSHKVYEICMACIRNYVKHNSKCSMCVCICVSCLQLSFILCYLRFRSYYQ